MCSLRDRDSIPTEIARELDEQLVECKVALQGQAQSMLELLLEFEARLKSRLEAAEARIAAFRAANGRKPNDAPGETARVRTGGASR